MVASPPAMFVRAQAQPASEPVELPARPPEVRLRARRNPRLIVLGVLCACVGALVMGWAWSSRTDSQTVVLVTRDVGRGSQISAADLSTTTLSGGAGVSVVPADQAQSMIGQYALQDLQAGSLLGPQAIGTQVVPPGTAHLGLRLAVGRLPNQPLPPGTPIWLVTVEAGAAAEASEQFDALVISAPAPASDGAWVFDVQVAEGQAAQVAAFAAQDQLTAVRKADG
ncbi:MAG: flagellar biosynthesis protein FlgA [Brooklawnia sp.]|jgi:hypothetical protein